MTSPQLQDARTATLPYFRQRCRTTAPPEWIVGQNAGAACAAVKYSAFKAGAKIASQGTLYSFNGTTCQANTGSDTWVLYGTTEQAASSLGELTDVTQ